MRGKSAMLENHREKELISTPSIKTFIFSRNSRKILNFKNTSTDFQNFYKNNTSTKSVTTFSINLPLKNSNQPIIHTYALPSKLLSHNKSEPSQNFSKFNEHMQVILKRFNKTGSINHIVKLDRKGMVGWKKRQKIQAKFFSTEKPNYTNKRVC